MIVNKTEACCGCEACVQACPRNCISMCVDSEGFAYPIVDGERCIDCGLCRKVCPVLVDQKPSDPEQTYAAYALREEIRGHSSSGGIFSLLAERVLEQQGVVFGAAFAEDFSVHHVKIQRKEELPMLRGSKYLQSRIEGAYSDVKTALEEGIPVLFSGVGCQIAGLKAFLGKEYEHLYTVDVLCHGVPSPELWKKYLREQEALFGADITDVCFRSKNTGWKNFSVKMVFANGKTYSVPFGQDPFMQCFLSNICLRPSCYSCRFRSGSSGADMTLGDAWGIQKQMPDMDDDRGTSVVLVNNQKGKKLWTKIFTQVNEQEGTTDALLRANPVYRKSVSPHPKRTVFFNYTDMTVRELSAMTQPTFTQKWISIGKRIVKKCLRMLGLRKN